MFQIPLSKLSVISLTILSLITPSVLAANNNDVGHCNTKPGVCDSYSPCCNSGGWCGRSYAFCGMGCLETSNFKGTKCLPKPACKAMTYKISKDRIITSKDYNGDYLKYDFNVDGEYEVQGDEIVLKMSKANSGATLHSTRYINHGRITVTMKTAKGKGIISSFITMSDDKDEIDFEWVGNNLEELQTNWFYKGIIKEGKENQGKKHKQANSYSNWHTYTLEWSDSKIVWSIDGQVVRTQSREGKEYPESATRFSVGLWDAGNSEQQKGTIEWAGGLTEWDSDVIKKDGYYSVRVKDIKVECFGKPLSEDKDFEVHPKFGLILKDSIKKASKDREGGELGSEDMFDQDVSGGSTNSGTGARNVIKNTRPNSSNSALSKISVSGLGLAALISLFN